VIKESLVVSYFLMAQSMPIPTDNVLQWGVREGGMLAVVLVVLYFYRKDFLLKIADLQAERAYLVKLVEANTTAIVSMQQINERLSRAVELNNSRRRAIGDIVEEGR
jgi:hypothetical protein